MSSKRPLEDAIPDVESEAPLSKKQKVCNEQPEQEEINEFTMKCDIIQDYIKEEDAKIHDQHSSVLSYMYRTVCKTNKPLIDEIKLFVRRYSVLNPLFVTSWSNKFKGQALLLNQSKLSFYTKECDINQSCRTNEPFPSNKKSKIKFKFNRNDECCFQASFIGVHYCNSKMAASPKNPNELWIRRIYNHSPFAPEDYRMYMGYINRISYGVLECGGWVDPKVHADDLDYATGAFGNDDVITIEADFTQDKNKKLKFFKNDNKLLFEHTLPYFNESDQWYPAVGYGSGES